jgi:hypothetical protein
LVGDMRAVVNVRGQSKIAVSKGYIGIPDAAQGGMQPSGVLWLAND